MLPEGSNGSTAIALPVPVIVWLLPALKIGAGPIEVQVLLESRFEGASSKIRKLAVAWSAVGSPRPVPETLLRNVSDHDVIVPVEAPALSTSSVQVPAELGPPLGTTKTLLSETCGSYVPKNGAPP